MIIKGLDNMEDNNGMKKIMSFSGGKDSTACLIRLLEEGYQVDEIIFFDTGWEFPEINDHVQTVQSYINREITILHPQKPFNYWMFEKPIVKRGTKEVHRIGNGWPCFHRRWCTREKVHTINRFLKMKYGNKYFSYIGFAADEKKRIKSKAAQADEKKGKIRLYPLIDDFNMSEKDCLEYCYSRGFDWNGLYDHFERVSCFCCPLQRVGEMKTLRKIRPELWSKMLEWDAAMMQEQNRNRGFYGYKTVHDLEERFAKEDLQMQMF